MRKWFGTYGFGSLTDSLGERICAFTAGGFLLPLICLLDWGDDGGDQDHVRAVPRLGLGPIAFSLGERVLLFPRLISFLSFFLQESMCGSRGLTPRNKEVILCLFADITPKTA